MEEDDRYLIIDFGVTFPVVPLHLYIVSNYHNLLHLSAILMMHFTCLADEKEPYEAKARADKKRYKDEVSGYKNPKPMDIDSGKDSDSA